MRAPSPPDEVPVVAGARLAPAPRSPVRQAALVLGVSRLAFAAGIVLAPRRVLRALVGDAHDRPAATAARAGLAARDLAVGVGIIRSVDGDVAKLLRLGAACDAADAMAVVAARRRLPSGGAAAVLTAALTGMVGHLVVAARVGPRG